MRVSCQLAGWLAALARARIGWQGWLQHAVHAELCAMHRLSCGKLANLLLLLCCAVLHAPLLSCLRLSCSCHGAPPSLAVGHAARPQCASLWPAVVACASSPVPRTVRSSLLHHHTPGHSRMPIMPGLPLPHSRPNTPTAPTAPADEREAEVVRIVRLLRNLPPDAQPDAYDVIGVAPTTPTADVKKRYWKLSLMIHPDKCSHALAHDAFQAVSKAAKVLQDVGERKALDAAREDAELRKLAEQVGRQEAELGAREAGRGPRQCGSAGVCGCVWLARAAHCLTWLCGACIAGCCALQCGLCALHCIVAAAPDHGAAGCSWVRHTARCWPPAGGMTRAVYVMLPGVVHMHVMLPGVVHMLLQCRGMLARQPSQLRAAGWGRRAHGPHSPAHCLCTIMYPYAQSRWLTVLCCAVLCCAVLCCAVLCCAVLCCAVLWPLL
jgi:hypothetical protein